MLFDLQAEAQPREVTGYYLFTFRATKANMLASLAES